MKIKQQIPANFNEFLPGLKEKTFKWKFEYSSRSENATIGYITHYSPILPEGKTPVEYMRVCFAALEMASIVVMLPNWTDSAGAKLEHDYAKYIGKKIIYLST